jgi:DNA-binding GntR family transcriptional regulator
MVECFALRRAVERGDVTWEADIVAAHHTLTVTPRYEDDDSSEISESWEQAHRRFHYALIAGCDMPIVLELSSSLFDASQLYRRLAVPLTEGARRDFATEYAQIMEAALAREVEVCLARLELHFRTTTKLLLTRLLQVGTHTWPLVVAFDDSPSCAMCPHAATLGGEACRRQGVGDRSC